jgi:small-conductance mechanosensitive channel
MEVINQIKEFLGLSLIQSNNINITIGALIAVVFAFWFTSFLLRMIRKFVTRKLPVEDTNKFISIFQFIKYLVYLFVIMFALNISGVNISVLLTASAAIFIGLGFALQQLFQDLIAGILIIVEQSLKVGDIIEINGKVGRVQRISLRSTRAYTRNHRVMIIPNHMFMNDLLFNWTQNNTVVRDNITIQVAYGSDTRLAEQLLYDSLKNIPAILTEPKPNVLFDNFGESWLDFVVNFYVNDAFVVQTTKSDLRFEVDKNFRANHIIVPFPQRELYINANREVQYSDKGTIKNNKE